MATSHRRNLLTFNWLVCFRPAMSAAFCGWALVLVLVLFVGAQVATAFEVLRVSDDPCDSGSRNLSWPSAAAPVDIDIVTPPGFENLAGEAYGRWNESVQRFRFRSSSGRPCDLNDGVVTVGISTTDCWGDPFPDDGTLALTTSRWRSDGVLLDAELVVNANSGARTNQAVFLEVVMHELGHVLGLDHSDACGNSGAGTLMRSVLFLSQPRLDRPQPDDIAGANFIYSSGSADPGGPEEPGSCAIARPCSTRWEGPLLLIPALLVLRRMLR